MVFVARDIVGEEINNHDDARNDDTVNEKRKLVDRVLAYHVLGTL